MIETTPFLQGDVESACEWLLHYLLEGAQTVYLGILDAHETTAEMAALAATYGTRVQIFPMVSANQLYVAIEQPRDYHRRGPVVPELSRTHSVSIHPVTGCIVLILAVLPPQLHAVSGLPSLFCLRSAG